MIGKRGGGSLGGFILYKYSALDTPAKEKCNDLYVSLDYFHSSSLYCWKFHIFKCLFLSLSALA